MPGPTLLLWNALFGNAEDSRMRIDRLWFIRR